MEPFFEHAKIKKKILYYTKKYCLISAIDKKYIV